MRKTIIAVLCASLIISISGCASDTKETISQTDTDRSICIANDFEMKLFSDKQVYKTTDAIRIWTTLEYVGNSDTVTIWHDEPCVSYTITDGEDFHIGGINLAIVTFSVLEKGEENRFDYQKSGGWSANDPKADYWESFFEEKDLLLPAGEYTVSVRGNLSLSSAFADSEFYLFCELKIKVEQ